MHYPRSCSKRPVAEQQQDNADGSGREMENRGTHVSAHTHEVRNLSWDVQGKHSKEKAKKEKQHLTFAFFSPRV
jgi:hypothetical protein